MIADTTEALADSSSQGLHTDRANGPHHIPALIKSQEPFMVQNQPFQLGDRFRITPLGDRYDNVQGTISSLFTSADGEHYAHTRHDDGTLTMWPLSRLEHIDPELPQRIRGATLTPSYVDAGVEPDPRDEVRGIVGEVSAPAIMEAARGFPEIFDTLVAVVNLPGPDVAALLRRVADVLDGGAR